MTRRRRDPGRGLRRGLRRGMARRRRDPGQPDGPDPRRSAPGWPGSRSRPTCCCPTARPTCSRRPDGPAQADGAVEGWLPYRSVFTVVGRGPRHVMMGAGAARPVRQPEHLLHRRLGPAAGAAARRARRARQHRQPPDQLLGAAALAAGSSSRAVDMVSGVGYDRAAARRPGAALPRAARRRHQPGGAGLPDPRPRHAAALGPSRGHGVRGRGRHRLSAGDPGRRAADPVRRRRRSWR